MVSYSGRIGRSISSGVKAMAYGKPAARPQKSSKPIKAVPQPLTSKIQQGKLGTEGASEDAYPSFGGMPSSGSAKPGAGSELMKGGSAKGSAVGSSHAKPSSGPSHGAVKKPVHAGSHGGASTGSVDTMTKLIFHPKGGLGRGEVSKKTPPSAPGYKDSGSKGPPQKRGVSH